MISRQTCTNGEMIIRNSPSLNLSKDKITEKGKLLLHLNLVDQMTLSSTGKAKLSIKTLHLRFHQLKITKKWYCKEVHYNLSMKMKLSTLRILKATTTKTRSLKDLTTHRMPCSQSYSMLKCFKILKQKNFKIQIY